MSKTTDSNTSGFYRLLALALLLCTWGGPLASEIGAAPSEGSATAPSEGSATAPSEDSATAPSGDIGVRRIGVLFWHDSPNDKLALEGFRNGLELVGGSFDLDIRNAHNDEADARAHLKRWQDENRNLVLALGTRATQLARDVLTETPIVYTAVTNPVLSGVATSWQSSGPGIAGNSNWIPADTLLRAFSRAVPELRVLGVISSVDNPVPAAEIAGVREALAGNRVRDLSLEVEVREVREVADLESAARSLVDSGVDAIWIPIDILVYENVHLIRQSSDPTGIPLLSSSHRGAGAGALLSIVVDYRNLGKNAAAIAVRILDDGVDPRSIPVGRLSGYRTIVNLARSREIGYRLPLEVVCTADHVIR